jgi:hypothetical protein
MGLNLWKCTCLQKKKAKIESGNSQLLDKSVHFLKCQTFPSHLNIDSIES